MVAPEIKDFVTEDELISYVEACLRVYNRYGRRDNKFKARIKILIHELGVDEYRRQVEEEFAHMKTLGLNPPTAEIDRIRRHFRATGYDPDLSAEIYIRDRQRDVSGKWVCVRVEIGGRR